MLLPFVLEEHHRDTLSIIQLYFELQGMWIQHKPVSLGAKPTTNQMFGSILLHYGTAHCMGPKGIPADYFLLFAEFVLGRRLLACTRKVDNGGCEWPLFCAAWACFQGNPALIMRQGLQSLSLEAYP